MIITSDQFNCCRTLFFRTVALAIYYFISACGPGEWMTDPHASGSLLNDLRTATSDGMSKTGPRATGDISLTTLQALPKRPWPVEVQSIGHTMASYQAYGGNEPPYFHHGLDIRAQAGSTVTAPRGGRIVNIENYRSGALYWEISILDDDGYVWEYHHIDRNAISREIMDAFQRGDRIEDGTVIGKVVSWPIATFGEYYHHIHLNIYGAGGQYVNPFHFLEPIGDQQTPVINSLSLTHGNQMVQQVSAKEAYGIVINTEDLIRHQRFVVPPYQISFRLNDSNEAKTVWQFDHLPAPKSRYKFAEDFYLKGRTKGNYQQRNIFINLGFDPSGTPFTFPKTNGEHKIEVSVRDFAGNETKKEFRWRIQDGEDAPLLEKQFNGVGRDIYLGIPESQGIAYVATNTRSNNVYACWNLATACQSGNAPKTALQQLSSGNGRKFFHAPSFNITPNQQLTLMSYDSNNQLIDIQTLQINASSR